MKSTSSGTKKGGMGGFILIFLVGTFLVVLASVPCIRTRIIRQRINNVPSQLESGSVEDALARLLQVRPWATSYPALLRELDCEIIRCHVAGDDLRSAWTVASDMFAAEPLPAASSTNQLALILDPANAIWNHLFLNDLPSNTSGLDTLEKELEGKGAEATLNRFRQIRTALVKDTPEPPHQGQTEATPSPPPTQPSISRVKRAAPRRSEKTRPTSVAPPQPQRQHTQPVEVDSHLQWGVVTRSTANVYTKQGKRITELKAGKLLDVVDVVSTKAGEMAIIKLTNSLGNERECVMKLTNLQLRPGTLATANPEEKRIRVDRAKLLALIDERKARLLTSRMARNPHRKEYEKQKKRYHDFWDEVKKLTALRDKAMGAKHVKYADQLRMMKGEDIQIANDYNAAKTKFDRWMESQGGGRNVTNDANLARMMKQLDDLETQLSKLL